MKTKQSKLFFLALVATLASGQSQKPEGAREYFFLGVQKKDALPVVKTVASRRPQAKPVSRAAPAMHLAFRYNLLVREKGSREWHTVDPDTVLHAGDYFKLQLSSNRSGYLFVLAKQSSGNWEPLLPSPEMKGESRVIDPGQPVTIPATYAYVIKDPPGDEELFVALSRDPDAIYQLQEDIEGPPASKEQQVRAPGPEPTEMADARAINKDVAQLAERFATRDIAIVKIGDEEAKADEPVHTVYVANKSSKPSANLVARFVIHHR